MDLEEGEVPHLESINRLDAVAVARDPQVSVILDQKEPSSDQFV